MPNKLGIIAGGGALPGQVLAAARAQGRDCFVLAIRNHAEDSAVIGVPHAWLGLGEAGQAFRLLQQNQVKDVVLAGPVRRPSLADLRPDWRTAAFFAKIGLKALGDDGLLQAVIAEFEAEGFAVLGAQAILGDLLAPLGVWGALAPDAQGLADIARGTAVARALGGLDVGQAVVVQQGIVLAVEAAEGTDALILRAATLCRQGVGGVLVKLCKPQQDRRVDLPTIGAGTVRRAAEAGLRGIAVEAGATLVLDLAGAVEAADRADLFLTGIDPASREAPC